MRISKLFKLGKEQPELDFIDIDPREDLRLFIDPYYLSSRNNPWSQNASFAVKNYFQKLIYKIRKEEKDVIQLLSYMHEPNETCLGLSKGKPQGRGVGKDDANKIYKSLLASKAVKTGLVEDLEDCHIFVDGFGKDKLSDMTTAIIRKYLIEYTQQQAKINGLPLTPGVPSGFYWDINLGQWNNQHTEMIVVDGRKILLVPKGIVSFSSGYTPDKYYNKFILTYLQNEHISLKSILVKRRKNGESYVTKKDLKKENPYTRSFLLEFSQKHPKIFKEFRKKAKEEYGCIQNNELYPCDVPLLIKSLIERLNKIPPGAKNASEYHRLIMGISELIFYPDLICPQIEKEINEGRKRIDITFDNAAEEDFFYDLHKIRNIPCPYVLIECKNYSNDPQNPELDQLIGRFSKQTRGKFGLLLCRNIKDMDLFLKRCKDALKDGHGLIIPLIDKDIIRVLEDIAKSIKGTIVGSKMIYHLLNDRCREIFMG